MRSGLVGAVGSSAQQVRAARRGAPAEPDDTERVLLDAEWGWIAARTRPGEHLTLARNPAGTTIAVLGLLVDANASPLTPASAEDLFPRWEAAAGHGRALDLTRFEGSYLVLVVDEHLRTVWLINDHLGSRPLFHGSDHAPFCFGRSEAEVVRLSGRPARLSNDGAAGFLAIGYPLGAYTLTEGVRRLRPASELTVRTDGSPRERRWWDLSFVQTRPTQMAEAVEELHALAGASLRATLADGARVHLALTGGYDSRMLLGLLREQGQLPDLTFTWRHRPGVAGSDPEVARELAAVAGLPHRVLPYAPESFAVHLEDWLRTSALGSDNLGHFCAGERFLADHGLAPNPVLLGDHVLGLGGSFAEDAEAISAVLRTPWPTLSPALQAFLTPEAMAQVRETVSAQVAAIAAEGETANPKDLHHYLYFHVGVFGWLLAPGYYKEPVVEARRPLASRALLAAAARWPAALRHDKRVVVALLRDRFPDLYAVQVADRSALVDWLAAVRSTEGVGNALHDMLDEATRDGRPGPDGLRADVLHARFSALRHSPPAATDRRRLRALAVRVRRAVGHLRFAAGPLRRLERLLRRSGRQGGGPDDTLRHLFRVGLLAAYERQLAGSAPTPTQATGETDGP